MIQKAGSKYVSTGRFNIVKTSIWLLIGLVAAYGIGWLYGFIAHINPFIYLNALLLIGVVFVLYFVLNIIVIQGESRNKLVNIISAFIISFFAWYVSWCYICADIYETSTFYIIPKVSEVFQFILYYTSEVKMSVGKAGRSGGSLPNEILFIVYLIEFTVFLVPIYFVLSSKFYFCENCENSLDQITFYADTTQPIAEYKGKIEKGNLDFLEDISLHSELDTIQLDHSKPMEVYQFEFHLCDKCRKNSVVNINILKLKLKEEKIETENTVSIIEGIYIDQKANDILLKKLELMRTTS